MLSVPLYRKSTVFLMHDIRPNRITPKLGCSNKEKQGDSRIDIPVKKYMLKVNCEDS